MGFMDSTRRWFSLHQSTLAVTAGVVGVGYLAAQYIGSRIRDARDRASDDRIAKDNLRRRFQQNQEDCSLTVLALFPAAAAGIFTALNTDKIAHDIQQLRPRKESQPASVAGSATTGPLADEDSLSLESSREQVDNTVDSRQLSDLDLGAHASAGASASASAMFGIPAIAPASVPMTQGSHAAEGSSVKPTKRQLWEEMKITSITRTFTLIYTLALLALLTRIQLNLLGRRSYLSSVVWLATGAPAGDGESPILLENNDDPEEDFIMGDNKSIPQRNGRDFDVNRRYLAYSWWLLHRGWSVIQTRVEIAVRAIFGHLSPRDALSVSTFAVLTARVREIVEHPATAHDSPWLSVLLPPVESETWVLSQSGILDPTSPESSDTPPMLRHLLDETADLIESAAFTHVFGLILHSAFSLLIDQKLTAAVLDLPVAFADAPSSSRPTDRAVLLPRLLSVLARQAHVISSPDSNEYLAEMDSVQDLEAFAAVVYSSNWENELRSPSAPLVSNSVEAFSSQAHTVSSAPHSRSPSAPVPNAMPDHPLASSTRDTSQSVVVVLPASAWTSDPPRAANSDGSGSAVMINTQSSFDSAWDKAREDKNT